MQSNFAFAFYLLPAEQRRGLAAVYRFCRAVDDAVDENDDSAAGKRIIAQWHEQLRLAFVGSPTTEAGLALQKAVREFSIAERDLEDILHGVEMDLTTKRYPTFDALYTYCYHVASAVGLAVIPIFGAKEARIYAEKLGVALQLTNIIRDVGEDAERGRIYLPLEDLARFSVTEADVMAKRMTPAFAALLSFEADRAERYYSEAKAALPEKDRRQLAAAEAMGAIYHELLAAIRRRSFEVFRQRVALPTLTKARLAFLVALRSRFSSP